MLPLLLLVSTPAALAREASPGDLAEEADLHFELAAEAWRRNDHRGALEHLLISNRLAPNRNVVYNIARTYERLGEFDSAFRHYSDYLLLETDPALRAEAEQAIDRIAGRVALVEITSSPPGATIYVDRKELGARGVTPLVLALPPGEHEVLLELTDHRPASARVEARTGQRVGVSPPLDPILGRVSLSGGPEGALVFVEGGSEAPAGTLPGVLDLPPGPQVLIVRAPGHVEARERVVVDPERPLELRVDLTVQTGTLVVDAVERGALISVDGAPAGFTPAVLEVPVGAHTVEITKAGFRTVTRDIEVVADQRLTLSLSLRSQQELSAASRAMERSEDAPASVSVITGAELRAFGYQEVYDAVAGTRGLFTTNDLTYQYLGVRGFGRPGDYGSRVLVTLDGHVLNDDQIGASYVGSDLLVDLEDVQQIEIVRGPGSALYGTNAFLGVINIVTRREGDPGAHAVVTADDGRTARARVGASLGDGQRGAWLSASGAMGQGQDYVFEEYADTPGGGQVIGADDMRAANLGARAWAGPIEVQGFYTGRLKRTPSGAFDTDLGDPDSTSEDQRAFVELRAQPTLGEAGRLAARAWVDHYRYNGRFPYEGEGTYEDTWRGTWLGLEPRLMLSPLPWLDLTAGAEGRAHVQARLTGRSPEGVFLDESPTQAVASGYAVADLRLGAMLRASVGGRYDWFSIGDVGGAFNPRAALVFQPDDANVVKLLAGTAFRAPSPYELFYNDGGQTQVRAGQLDPERVATGELEVTHRFSDVVSATGSAWANRITGLVDTALVAGEDEVFRYVNTADQVLATGLDLELRRDWLLGSMFAVQGTVQRAAVGGLIEGEPLTNSPRATLSLKGAAPTPIPGATAATRLVVEGPRLTTQGTQTPPGLNWDLTLSGELADAPVSWSLGVRNLLDWRVEHPGGYDLLQDAVPQPGRSAFARVRVDL